MASSMISSKRCTVRSTSFPSTLHPSACKIEEGLNKIRTWEAEASNVLTAETVCDGLCRLGELYKFTDEFLNLPLTQQALSHHQNMKCINELMDKSVRLLDICGNTRDIMSQIKVHARDLQSALRRKKGDLNAEFTAFRKAIHKDSKRMIAALKQVDNKTSGLENFDQDQHLAAVIRSLKGVTAASIIVFQSVLLFLSTPILKPKATKWMQVSKLMHKGAVASEDQQHDANEVERVKALESDVEGIENGLECMFRHFIRTRASLLNSVSQ
ncbi:uncharacterized protein LOC141677450 [Apium graveolens]|uniref:uncharacterized protein LOC141677450 n=1 Tax=Apium graveolens TaxID=4045 RepID=UPI003D7BB758